MKTEKMSIGIMSREQTMEMLHKVGNIAEQYENLISLKNTLEKKISEEKEKAEELRTVVSKKAKTIKRLAILCSFLSWFALSFWGIFVTIIVWIMMNQFVIKRDLIKHEAENNANAEKFLIEVVAPHETMLQEVDSDINALYETGKIDWAKDVVGEDMFFSECIGDLYDLIKNRRADNLKEALNLYDDIQYKARMEASQAAIQNATEVAAAEAVKQTAYAKDTAKNTHQTATAAKATAYHTRQVQKNTKQIQKNTRRFR